MISHSNHNHQGFTLVELLVSITVIGILMGLMFPALNMVRAKAWNSAGKDLCSQTAAAWTSILLDARRFPSEELIKYCAADTFDSNSDIGFVMDTKASSLLHWWVLEHPLPTYDLKKYKTQIADIDFSWAGIAKWPNDLRLERTPEQRQWGLIAPWTKRWVKGAAEGTLSVEAKKNVEAGTVRVLIDSNGDGMITVPSDLGACALDGDGNALVLKKSAIAWVYADGDKKNVLTSW